MRTVSLVPAASSWMAALGLQEYLVGATEACSDRIGAPDLPVVAGTSGTRTPIRALEVSGPVERTPDAYVDADTVRKLQPDLVIVDRWNERWPDDLPSWFSAAAGKPVSIHDWSVRTYRDALEEALGMARRYGAMDRILPWMGAREAELMRIRTRTGIHRRAPDSVLEPVALLSDVDPPVLAAGWTADVVDRAAARLTSAGSGEPARETTWDDPAIGAAALVLVSPTGRSARESVEAARTSPDAASTLSRCERAVFYDGRGRLDAGDAGLHEAILDLAAIIHRFPDRNVDGRMVPWRVGGTEQPQ